MTRPTASSSIGSGSLAARAILATCLIAGAGLALGGACSSAPGGSDGGGTGTGGGNGSGGVALGTGGGGGGMGGGSGAGGAIVTGAGGGSACASATVNGSCSSEGTKCSLGCTDACSFCNLLSCTGGHWVQLESVPAPCFDCGPSLRCRIGVQICAETVGGAVGATPQYQCSALPAPCQSTPTCACVAPGSANCTESGTGQLTVTNYAP